MQRHPSSSPGDDAASRPEYKRSSSLQRALSSSGVGGTPVQASPSTANALRSAVSRPVLQPLGAASPPHSASAEEKYGMPRDDVVVPIGFEPSGDAQASMSSSLNGQDSVSLLHSASGANQLPPSRYPQRITSRVLSTRSMSTDSPDKDGNTPKLHAQTSLQSTTSAGGADATAAGPDGASSLGGTAKTGGRRSIVRRKYGDEDLDGPDFLERDWIPPSVHKVTCCLTPRVLCLYIVDMRCVAGAERGPVTQVSQRTDAHLQQQQSCG